MKKVLITFDGMHFSNGAFDFARYMNECEPILLTGLFLPEVDYIGLWNYATASAGPFITPVMERESVEVVQANIERFEMLCTKHNIDYRVHNDFVDFALPELKKETRFADLAIVGSEMFYKNLGTKDPNEYLREALHLAECPIMLVPEKFDLPQSNILAYDGSKSSVFAIRQFAYLFPELTRNSTLLVTANEEGTKMLPEEQYIEELAGRHFPDLTLFKLELDPRKYFATWISEKKNAILVSGAFTRSSFSQLFRKSFVSDVIKDHKLPVFIAHR
jgi:hypothetical protein